MSSVQIDSVTNTTGSYNTTESALTSYLSSDGGSPGAEEMGSCIWSYPTSKEICKEKKIKLTVFFGSSQCVQALQPQHP